MEVWVSQVGEDRALIALSIFNEKTGSRTLPELLTENYLRGQGARYITQLNLGFSKPDFVVFGAPAAPEGALVIRVQGQHWHSSADAITRDQGQKDLLMQGTAQGSPIIKVIDVWESSLYRVIPPSISPISVAKKCQGSHRHESGSYF